MRRFCELRWYHEFRPRPFIRMGFFDVVKTMYGFYIQHYKKVKGNRMKLVINELRKSYDSKEVLKGVSFRFEKGKIYGLLGRNGSGKTTLFNCLNEDTIIDGGTF